MVRIVLPLTCYRPGPRHSMHHAFSGLGSDQLLVVVGTEDIIITPPEEAFEVENALDARYLVERHGGHFLPDVVDVPKPDIMAAKSTPPKPKSRKGLKP